MILSPLNLTDNTLGSWNFNNQNMYGLDIYSTGRRHYVER